MRAWWVWLQAAYQEWRAPRYPIITVNWGETLPGTRPQTRGCGHVSASFAYDPLREVSLCLACYRGVKAGGGR